MGSSFDKLGERATARPVWGYGAVRAVGEGSISLAARTLWRYKYPMSRVFSAKKKTGRPRVDSEAVNVRLERPALDILDAWIAAQPEPRPSRPEAIRRLLVEALGRPADVKSPTLPPASDAFLRALGHRQEDGEGPA
jgi:hypothetical protein